MSSVGFVILQCQLVSLLEILSNTCSPGFRRELTITLKHVQGKGLRPFPNSSPVFMNMHQVMGSSAVEQREKAQRCLVCQSIFVRVGKK